MNAFLYLSGSLVEYFVGLALLRVSYKSSFITPGIELPKRIFPVVVDEALATKRAQTRHIRLSSLKKFIGCFVQDRTNGCSVQNIACSVQGFGP